MRSLEVVLDLMRMDRSKIRRTIDGVTGVLDPLGLDLFREEDWNAISASRAALKKPFSGVIISKYSQCPLPDRLLVLSLDSAPQIQTTCSIARHRKRLKRSSLICLGTRAQQRNVNC
jgi:hypothetical protein